VFQLVLTDQLGGISLPDTVSIQVNANQVPVADAGDDQDGIVPGQLVTLDSSGSFDPEGQTFTREWSQTDGPAVTLSSTTAVSPTFTPTVDGTYEFQLVLTDSLGGVSDPDTVSIEVNPNQDPVANAGPDQSDVPSSRRWSSCPAAPPTPTTRPATRRSATPGRRRPARWSP
jgi:hypothetical protein